MAKSFASVCEGKEVTPANPVTVVRFCGTSVSSTSINLLLSNITEQVHRAYSSDHLDRPSLPADFKELVKTFWSALKLATETRPLCIFIDSLDQMSDAEFGRTQPTWLPIQLPPHVSVVVSTLAGAENSLPFLLQTQIPNDNYLEVTPMSLSDTKGVVEFWLQTAERQLRDDQLEHLLNSTNDGINEIPTLLRLKLNFDLAVQWKSYERLPQVPNTVFGLISKLFDGLELELGKEFVTYSLALITIAKNGLTETEILDMLSGSEEVLSAVLKYHQPPVRRVPQVVMSRLLHSLKNYVVRRGFHGKTVLSWFHRQFKEAAMARYVEGTDGQGVKYARLIADYFSEEMHLQFPDRELAPQPLFYERTDENTVVFNYSAISELPWAVLSSKDEARFAKKVCNLKFVVITCSAGLMQNLVECYYSALSLSLFTNATLPMYYQFLVTNANSLVHNGDLVLQQALALPEDDAIHQEAIVLRSSHTLPWTKSQIIVKNLTKDSQEAKVRKLTLHGHSDVVTAIQYVSEHNVILTASHDGRIMVWIAHFSTLVLVIDCQSPIWNLSTVGKTTAEKQGTGTFKVIASCADGQIKIYEIFLNRNVASCSPITVWSGFCPIHPKDTKLTPHVFDKHKDEAFLVSGCTVQTADKTTYGQIFTWDLRNILENPSEIPKALAFRNNANGLLESSEMTDSDLGISSIAVSPNGQLVAVGLADSKNRPGGSKLLVCVPNTLEVICRWDTEVGSLRYLSTFEPTQVDDKTPEDAWRLVASIDTQMDQLQQTRALVEVRNIKGSIELITKHHYDFSDAYPLGPSVALPAENMLLTGFRHFLKVTSLFTSTKNVSTTTGLDIPVETNMIAVHGSRVRAIELFKSSTAPFLCTADARGTVKMWDFKNLLDTYKLPAMHLTGIWTCAVSLDGTRVVTGCGGSGSFPTADLKCWNPKTGEMIGTTAIFTYRFHGMAFSPDGKFLCFRNITNPNLIFWDTDRLKQTSIATEDSFVIDVSGSELTGKLSPVGKDSLQWSADGKRVIHSSPKGDIIYIVNIDERTATTFKAHEDLTIGARFTPDDLMIITWGSHPIQIGDRSMVGIEVKLFHTADFKECARYTTGKELLLKDEKATFVEGADQRKWGLASLTCARQSLKDYAVMGTYTGHLLVLSLPHLVMVQSLQAHDQFITCLTSSRLRDFTVVVTAGDDKWLKIWKCEQMTNIQLVGKFYYPTLILCLAISIEDNGVYINFGDAMGRTRVLQVEL